MPRDVFARWVATQLRGPQLDQSPGHWVRSHRDGWVNVFSRVAGPDTVLELPALVITRWEFLGCLYRGNTGAAGTLDAVTFAKRFLERVNPRYAQLHNLAGRTNSQPNQSDIYEMLRNRVLHGLHPAAVESAVGDGVVAWWIGPSETGGPHLEVDAQGKLHLNGQRFWRELIEAMSLFADLLDEDNEIGSDVAEERAPQARWLRAFWARYTPHGQKPSSWLARGHAYGIPA
jgi:hypothetical protein